MYRVRNSLIISKLKNLQNHDLQRTDFQYLKHLLTEKFEPQKFGILLFE